METADLVTFTEEIINGKLHFLCSDSRSSTFYYEKIPIKENKINDRLILFLKTLFSEKW